MPRRGTFQDKSNYTPPGGIGGRREAGGGCVEAPKPATCALTLHSNKCIGMVRTCQCGHDPNSCTGKKPSTVVAS